MPQALISGHTAAAPTVLESRRHWCALRTAALSSLLLSLACTGGRASLVDKTQGAEPEPEPSDARSAEADDAATQPSTTPDGEPSDHMTVEAEPNPVGEPATTDQPNSSEPSPSSEEPASANEPGMEPIFPVVEPGTEPAAEPQMMPTMTPADTEELHKITTHGADLEGYSNDDIGFDGVASVFFFGDNETTVASESGMQKVCMRGVAADAGNDYLNWGAGIGVQVSQSADGGFLPMDAAAAGVSLLAVDVTGLDPSEARVRVGVAMVNRNGLPYEENIFIINGSTSRDLDTETNLQISLKSFEAPPWTDPSILEGGAELDLSQLHAVHFQVVTVPGESREYSFCIENLRWLNGQGQRVDVPEPAASP